MKNFGGIKTRYLPDGTNIIAQEVTNGDSLDYICFFYDASGSPVGMNYLGNNYYYKKNLQGDIIEIRGTDDGTSDTSFRCLVKYVYDAWGNILQMNDTTDGWFKVGTANPFRYRGYYYDNESCFYYLQSRYYDPTVGRFVNADDPVIAEISYQTTFHNIFTHCENEPVFNADYQGFFVIRRWMVSAIVDILLSFLPGIGSLFAPVKSIAKAYGKAALKAKLAGPLGSFVKFVAGSASKLLNGFKNGLSKLWGVGRWIAKKIPVGELTSMLAGFTSSVVINKFLNIIVPNIDIVLSLGGLLAGVLDYIFDKSLNNSIWVV